VVQPCVVSLTARTYLCAEFLAGKCEGSLISCTVRGVGATQQKLEVRVAVGGDQGPVVVQLCVDVIHVTLKEHVRHGDLGVGQVGTHLQSRLTIHTLRVLVAAAGISRWLHTLSCWQTPATELRQPVDSELLLQGLSTLFLGSHTKLLAGPQAWSSPRALGQVFGADHQSHVLGTRVIHVGPLVLNHSVHFQLCGVVEGVGQFGVCVRQQALAHGQMDFLASCWWAPRSSASSSTASTSGGVASVRPCLIT